MDSLKRDVEVIENLLIAMNEGASDEMYSALWAVEKLLLEKKDLIREMQQPEVV